MAVPYIRACLLSLPCRVRAATTAFIRGMPVALSILTAGTAWSQPTSPQVPLLDDTQHPQPVQQFGPTGIASMAYHFPYMPADGFDQFTLTLRINETPAERGYYYGMQFSFLHGNGGYIGIQPRTQDSALAVFTVFGKGAEPVTEHCQVTSDAAPSVTCRLMMHFVPGHRYAMAVHRDEHDPAIWRGYVTDTTDKTAPQEIGAWKPRSTALGISNKGNAFIEYHPLISTCNDIPPTTAVYGAPQGYNGEGYKSGSRLHQPLTFGRCKALPFTATAVSGGWQIMTGSTPSTSLTPASYEGTPDWSDDDDEEDAEEDAHPDDDATDQAG